MIGHFYKTNFKIHDFFTKFIVKNVIFKHLIFKKMECRKKNVVNKFQFFFRLIYIKMSFFTCKDFMDTY